MGNSIIAEWENKQLEEYKRLGRQNLATGFRQLDFCGNGFQMRILGRLYMIFASKDS